MTEATDMPTTGVVLRGALTEDGQLVLDEKPDLPPGRVEIIVRPVRDQTVTGEHPMFETLKRIWAKQEARGFRGRTLEEAIADVRALRDEWAARDRRIEGYRDECRARREARARESGEA
jgi:hypothetical protein